MSPKDLFNAVTRLAGLYMLLQALAALAGLILMARNVSGGMDHEGVMLQLLVTFLISILGQGLVGYFMLAYAHRIVAFAWAAEDAEAQPETPS